MNQFIVLFFLSNETLFFFPVFSYIQCSTRSIFFYLTDNLQKFTPFIIKSHLKLGDSVSKPFVFKKTEPAKRFVINFETFSVKRFEKVPI